MAKIERLENKNAELGINNANLNRKYQALKQKVRVLSAFEKVGLSVLELKEMIRENTRLKRQERDMRLALARKLKASDLVEQLAALFR